MATTGVVTMATTAAADPDPAGLTITKTGPAPEALPLAPGDTFNYTIQVTCNVANCYDAQLTDTLPPPLELAGTPTVVSAGPYVVTPIDSDGDGIDDSFDVDFTDVFDDPANPGQGIVAGTTATVTVPVRVPADANYDYSGQELLNTAEVDASNADSQTDSWPVEIEVIPDIATEVTKSFDPSEGVASANGTTTATISGSNASSTGVDSIVIADPPAGSSSNTFDYLDLTDVTISSVPAGTDVITVTVSTTGGDVPIDVNPSDPTPIVIDLASEGIDPATVTGVTVAFEDDGTAPRLDPGEVGTVELGFIQEDPGTLTADQVVANEASSTADRDGMTGTETADADYTITTNIPTIDASKTFDPDTVLHGGESDATITAGVGGDIDVTELTVTEPSSGSFDTNGMYFTGFSGPVEFPEGAVNPATITYTMTDGSTATVDFDNNTVPALPPGVAPGDIANFSITFTAADGSVLPAGGTVATIPVGVGTADVDGTDQVTYPNQIEATGTTEEGVNGSDTAQDDLYAFDEHIDPTADKQVLPGTITGRPGEWVVLQLSGGIAPRPVDGNTDDPYSTIGADSITIQDPSDPTAPSDFWDAFEPSSIANVNVPDGVQLQINYWDGDSWEPLVLGDGQTNPVTGEANFSYDFASTGGTPPEDIGGIQFVYTPTDPDETFPPGTEFKPNVVMDLDEDWTNSATWPDNGDPISLTNCASGTGEGSAGSETVAPDAPAEACDSVDITDPESGGGSGPVITKNIVDEAIPARSHDETSATLHWSTGSNSNMDSVTVLDETGVPATDANVAYDTTGKFYDSFDLTGVSVNDPLLQYDAIDAVQLYNGDTGQWEGASNSACDGVIDGTPAGACEGAMPAFELTEAEQATTVAIRIIYVENPDTDARAPVAGEVVPPVGSGVARSAQSDQRKVHLDFRVRDWLRSDDTTPVEGGNVVNPVSVASESVLNGPKSDTDNDNIVITPVDLSVATTKTWNGSPVGIPPEGTDQALYPHTGVRLTVTNSSTIAYIDELSIVDRPTIGRPAGDTTILMSDVFNIESIDSIGLPAGADGFTLYLYDDESATPALTATTPAEFHAFSEADLIDIIGLEVVFDGRSQADLGVGDPTTAGIEPGARGTINFTLELREEDRYRNVTINTDENLADYVGQEAHNASEGIATDAAAPDPATAEADATVLLDQYEIGVAVEKGFSSDVTAGRGEWQDPFTQVETVPESRDEFVMWLSVTPTEGARPLSMDVSDLDPTFWNTYEFVEVDSSFALANPIQNVEMLVCLNSDNPLVTSGSDLTGGCERVVDPTTDEATYPTLTEVYSGSGTPVLSAGIDASDVNGLAFTFSSDAAWDDPWNPEQLVPVVVKRRVEHLTGGAPETDYTENAPAPGETNAGQTVNTVEGSITAALGSDGNPDNQLQNSNASDDAMVIYQHAVTAATVTKNPGAENGTATPFSPGASVPFTLTYTNIGDTPIYNPVFTDVIPDADNDGTPDLRLDPNLIQQGLSPYTYAVDTTGAEELPAGWAAPGVDEGDVIVSPEPATGNPSTIEFAFPDGTALAAGASYTITIQMIPQPGYLPDIEFTNTAAVTGDALFDYCDTDDGDPGLYQESCSGEATNTVAAGGAIRTWKVVRPGDAENPDLTYGAFVRGDTSSTCDPFSTGLLDDFYQAPCTPRTIEGEIETWGMGLQNSGNVPVESIVAVDRLPAIGDTSVLAPFSPRGSQWRAELVDPLAQVVLPSGTSGEVVAYVSTETQLCLDVLLDSGDCAGRWTEWTAYTGDPADVTGVMYTVDFDDGMELQPGDSGFVLMETRTPATVPADADTIAYNSIATSAETPAGHIDATEGVKVGVALATGSIDIVKGTDGDGVDEYGPDEYTVTLICTVDIDGTDVEVINQDYTVTPNTPESVTNLPTGAECTLEEGDFGQWSSWVDPETVSVPFDGAEDPENVSITLTNVYRLASLQVSKFVTSDGPSGAGPNPIGPFDIGVLCYYQGGFVQATNTDSWEPYGPGSPVMVVSLFHDESEILDDLPAGATCFAGEYPGHGASTVGIEWRTAVDSGGHFEEVVDEDDPITGGDSFVLTPDDENNGDATTNFVDVYNQYAAGELEITKEVSGPGADEHANDDFTIDLRCEYTDPDDSNVVVVTYDGQVAVPAGETVTVDDIIVGSECTLTEPEDGRNGADQWAFAPSAVDDPTTGVITVTDGEQTPAAAITVNNRFEVPTELVVDKIVDGPILNPKGDIPDIAPVTVDVVCTYAPGTPYERPVTAAEFTEGELMEFELAHGETMTLTELPTGTECVVTETDQAGASSTTVVAHPAGTLPGQPVDGTDTSITLNEAGLLTTNEVTFTNTYPVGSLDLTKELTGDGAVERGDGPFVLHVQCYSDAYDVVSYEGDVTLGGDEPLTATITNILAPSTCEVTETEDGGADAVFFTPGTPEVKSATVDIVEDGDQAIAAVTVENHFEPFASIEVTKTVDPVVTDADGNVPDLGPYLVWVRCTYDEGGPDEHTVYADGHGPLRPMVALLNDGESVSFTDIPATSTCTVTEVDTADAAGTSVTTATADVVETTADGVAGTVVLTPDNPDTTNTVGFTNVYDVGSLNLVKELVGDGVDDATGPYIFDVLCTWEREDRDPVVTWDGTLTLSEEDGMTATVDGIAAGSECLVTETDNGGADDTRLTPAGDSDNQARVTIAAASSVTVTAYNQFDAPAVLPITGYEGWWAAVTALAVLLAGVFLVLIARRRRS